MSLLRGDCVTGAGRQPDVAATGGACTFVALRIVLRDDARGSCRAGIAVASGNGGIAMRGIWLLTTALFAAGCAPVGYRPIVDSGTSRGSYEADLADCQNLAGRRPAAARAAGAATAGAALGALFALAVGLRGEDVAHVAAWSATSYGIAGGVEGSEEQRAIVSRCLAGRGYHVIAD